MKYYDIKKLDPEKVYEIKLTTHQYKIVIEYYEVIYAGYNRKVKFTLETSLLNHFEPISNPAQLNNLFYYLVDREVRLITNGKLDNRYTRITAYADGNIVRRWKY